MTHEPLDSVVGAWSARLPGFADPASPDAMLALLRLLYAAGRQDLPLGRLLEGHVDALQIVSRCGTPVQIDIALAAAGSGRLFGVWNADLAGDPLRLESGALNGGKSFASGAGLLDYTLVTIEREGQRQLLMLDLAEHPPLIDRSWWRTTGMARSETHLVRWQEKGLGKGVFLGLPGDYVREPWFSGGALRFAAVQAGGIAAVVDQVKTHLVNADRAGNPHQAGRIAALYRIAQAAADAVRTAALEGFGAEARTLALVSAARTAVYEAADEAIAIAQQAVGMQAMFIDHPLSRALTDLAVYVRQPAPDEQRMRVGTAVADGTLTPAL